MFTFNNKFCNDIAQLSIKKFNDLPKTGKPNLDEWTILSTIAEYDSLNNNLEVVALGTGTKCIGATIMSPNGDILNDSHAEIICRRAFLKYLYFQINNALNGKRTSIFSINENKCILRDNFTFHFFTTHVPCGDAAIFPKQESEDFGNCLETNNSEHSTKRLHDFSEEIVKKKIKLDMTNCNDVSCINLVHEETDDIFRTGAKCLTNDLKQDSKLCGAEYHTLGAIRTKPGRGDPTLSVSCSDKITKWTYLGIQGALLSYLLTEPIYLTSFTIVGNVPFSKDSLIRTIKTRFDVDIELPFAYQRRIPFVGQAEISFSFCKNESRRPCSSSIIWSNVEDKQLEIAVNGKKQGVTKKNRNKKEGRLSICKKELFNTFTQIIKLYSNLNLYELQHLSYGNVKKKSKYYDVRNLIKTNIFKIWSIKNDELLNFLADE